MVILVILLQMKIFLMKKVKNIFFIKDEINMLGNPNIEECINKTVDNKENEYLKFYNLNKNKDKHLNEGIKFCKIF